MIGEKEFSMIETLKALGQDQAFLQTGIKHRPQVITENGWSVLFQPMQPVVYTLITEKLVSEIESDGQSTRYRLTRKGIEMSRRVGSSTAGNSQELEEARVRIRDLETEVALLKEQLADHAIVPSGFVTTVDMDYLTAIQVEIYEQLKSANGHYVNTDFLLELFDGGREQRYACLRSHISKMRTKLEKHESPWTIEARSRKGYRLLLRNKPSE